MAEIRYTRRNVNRIETGDNMKPILVVMAAGMGSRFGGVKQIVPVGQDGEIIINYSVYDAIQAGFSKVVFIIRKDIEKDFKEVIAEQIPSNIPVEYCYQELDSHVPNHINLPTDRVKPLGTAHTIICATEAIDAPFAVINADDFYGDHPFHTMAEYLKNLDPESTEFAMMGYQLDKTLSTHGTVSRGICTVDSHGWLQKIEENLKIGYQDEKIITTAPDGSESELTGKEPTSMNFFGFSPAILTYLQEGFVPFLEAEQDNPKSEYLLPKEVDKLLSKGVAKMKVLPTPASWFGVTYKEDLQLAKDEMKKLAQDGTYPTPLWG